jgi:hypothetical protein
LSFVDALCLGPILELHARFNVSVTHIYESVNVHLRLAEHIELATFSLLHCIGLSGDQRSVDLNTRQQMEELKRQQ